MSLANYVIESNIPLPSNEVNRKDVLFVVYQLKPNESFIITTYDRNKLIYWSNTIRPDLIDTKCEFDVKLGRCPVTGYLRCWRIEK